MLYLFLNAEYYRFLSSLLPSLSNADKYISQVQLSVLLVLGAMWHHSIVDHKWSSQIELIGVGRPFLIFNKRINFLLYIRLWTGMAYQRMEAMQATERKRWCKNTESIFNGCVDQFSNGGLSLSIWFLGTTSCLPNQGKDFITTSSIQEISFKAHNRILYWFLFIVMSQ